MVLYGALQRSRRWLEHLYTERDFFLPYKILMALPGFHLASSFQSHWMRVLFAVTRFVLVFQYVVWGARFYQGLVNASTQPRMALHYGNSFGVLTMMLVRVLVVRWFLPDVERLKAYLRRQRRRSSTIEANRASYRKIVKIAVTFQLLGLVDRVLFAFSSTYRVELYEVPANMAELGRPVEVLVQVLSFDFAMRWATAYNVSLTSMNSIMMGLKDELSAIANEYEQLLGPRNNSHVDRDVFWAQFERNTAQTVHRHEMFLWQVKKLKPFLQTTFLVMFYSAAVFLALGTFMISANGTTTYDAILSGFLFALLLECYWCCRLVDRLNDLNEYIGELLYSLEWATELRYTPSTASRYRQARSSLLIMMSKSQKTLGITCGGMFEMSSEAFANLVKMVYTILMFLRDTNNLE